MQGIKHTKCGKVSWNSHDLEQKYCGACHVFLKKGEFEIVECEHTDNGVLTIYEMADQAMLNLGIAIAAERACKWDAYKEYMDAAIAMLQCMKDTGLKSAHSES